MARVTWSDGGTATIAALEGDRIELVSSRAFAPGSRPEGTVDETGDPVWLKVHASRGQVDGAFRVRGRLLNMRRDAMARLKDAVLAPNSAKRPAS